MLGLHRHLPLVLLLSACSQAPIGIGTPQDPSSFRVTAEALQADWMRIDIADTFTGEAWWSFLPEGRFQETYRRHDVVERNISTRRAEGSYRALEGGDLLIEWTDAFGGMQRQELSAAIVRGDSPAPKPDIPSYLDGAERLVPAARRLTTRAFVSADGLRYRRFSSVEVKGANSPAVVQIFEVIIQLDAPLSALARGEAVNAEVTGAPMKTGRRKQVRRSRRRPNKSCLRKSSTLRSQALRWVEVTPPVKRRSASWRAG